MEILPEIHADIETQFRLVDAGYWIYDFILPYLVLETLITKSSEKLKEYLRIRPDKQFTTLDCHDGVPLKPDMNGLYDSNIAQHVVDVCIERGANISPIFSEAHKDQDGFDVHQINGTYYSLLGSDDSTYLIARAIQFFTPGIPQIYYVGLLAGENDEEAVGRTGEGREINRHNYSIKEIEQEVERPVVKKLIELIKFRNTYPAFNGQFSIENSDNKIIILKWADNSLSTTLNIDLEKMTGLINYIDPLTQKTKEIIL
jgi:sucrose 6(F)-phosphate phosphorylase